MRKFKLFSKNPDSITGAISWILLVCIISCGGAYRNKNILVEDKINLRDELINIASLQIGIKEATGKNDGKDVYKYQKNIGLKPGAAWCGAFVTWNFDSLQHIALDNDMFIQYPRTGVAANWVNSNIVYIQGKTKELNLKKGTVLGEGYGNSVTHAAIFIEMWDSYHYVKIGGNETNQVKRSVQHIKYLKKASDYLIHIKK